MATGRSTQLTRQIGEHLVAAELGRRGLIATPFAGNVPLFDLLVADEAGRAIPIQVKTINENSSWQFGNIKKFLNVELVERVQHVRGKVQLPHPEMVCVFVLLHTDRKDEFYIFRLRDLQDHLCTIYTGGERPRNFASMHCAIRPGELSQYKDKWNVIFEALKAVGRLAA
jgi:hypothetical protein